MIHVHQALSANIFLPFPLSECVETSEIIVYSQDIMVRFFIDQLTLLCPYHTLPHSTLFLISLETDFCETVPKKLEEQISSQLIPGETENENKETEPFFLLSLLCFFSIILWWKILFHEKLASLRSLAKISFSRCQTGLFLLIFLYAIFSCFVFISSKSWWLIPRDRLLWNSPKET